MFEELEEKVKKLSDEDALEDVVRCSRSDISTFERENNIAFPEDYKWFLGRYGGIFLDCVYTAKVPSPWASDGQDAVEVFYGLGGDSDLAEAMEMHGDVLPTDVVPIAGSSGGNQICVGVGEKNRGRVLFWDHEGENRDEAENLYLVSDRFADFLLSLQLEEETDPSGEYEEGSGDVWLADDLLPPD